MPRAPKARPNIPIEEMTDSELRKYREENRGTCLICGGEVVAFGQHGIRVHKFIQQAIRIAGVHLIEEEGDRADGRRNKGTEDSKSV